jgi:hypothetical protein
MGVNPGRRLLHAPQRRLPPAPAAAQQRWTSSRAPASNSHALDKALLQRIGQASTWVDLQRCLDDAAGRGAPLQAMHLAAAFKRLVLIQRTERGVSPVSEGGARQPAAASSQGGHLALVAQLLAGAERSAQSLNSGQVATILWAAGVLGLQPSGSCLAALQVGFCQSPHKCASTAPLPPLPGDSESGRHRPPTPPPLPTPACRTAPCTCRPA